MGFVVEGKQKIEAYAILFSTISYEDEDENEKGMTQE